MSWLFPSACRARRPGQGGTASYPTRGWSSSAQRRGTGARRFVYDGANVIAETDDNGNLQVVNTYGVDGLVSSRAAGQSYFYHFDGLGSTRAMTNSQAQLVEVYDYEAFGNELLSQGGLTTPYRYVGQLGYYRHDDVELDLLGARYYAPEFGRFLTRDPVSRFAGPNLYAYCHNAPPNAVDPDGAIAQATVCVPCFMCLGFFAWYFLSCRGDCAGVPDPMLCMIDCYHYRWKALPKWVAWLCGGSCAVCLLPSIVGIIDTPDLPPMPRPNPPPEWPVPRACFGACACRTEGAGGGPFGWVARLVCLILCQGHRGPVPLEPVY